MSRRPRPDSLDFIRTNTRLAAVPTLPGIRLHMAHEATGLWQLADDRDPDPPPPYWAFPWAGGMALARYIVEHPEVVAGRRVHDLGSGSGLVAIAAAQCGAVQVGATDIDPFAIAATTLNAAANGVTIDVACRGVLGGAPPLVDILAVGDLFYEAVLARRVTEFLDRCLAKGIFVLIGDPGRTYLPRNRLRLLAQYTVHDVGEVEDAPVKPSEVYAFVAQP